MIKSYMFKASALNHIEKVKVLNSGTLKVSLKYLKGGMYESYY